MSYNFYAFLSRMKYINRWALMRNTDNETLSQHSFEVGSIAYALAVIGNKRFNGNYNCERAALLGLFHDMPEILTGDLPTPVKYYNNDIKKAYDVVEEQACKKLIESLPEDLKEDFEPLLIRNTADENERRLVKASDKLSALIKCIEERKAGNTEFIEAEKATLEAIKKLACPEANEFIGLFIDGYEKTLDVL